ncbi:MAG: glycolate oxidase subunit GlcE [Sedimenticola sp.]
MTTDMEKALQEQVTTAAADGTPLNISGGNTKSFLGRNPQGSPLDVTGHTGILSYEPKELVITARCGTPLTEIEDTLREQGQMLAFEPPHFGQGATLGGTIAAGLSGPRRPYTGSARDFVLGTRILNGRGDILRFGGEVMKNVAGYDISRLMTGAMGTLGIILDVSLKVLPIPAKEITLLQSRSHEDALQAVNKWSDRPIPLSASCSDGERLYIRLSGTATAVSSAREIIGGEVMEDGNSFWTNRIREQKHAFFNDGSPLWRVSIPASTPFEKLPGKCLIDWGGGLRWLKTDLDHQSIQETATAAGGHATLFRGSNRQGNVYQALPKPIMTIQQNLKRAFDPQGLLNPGRMYPEL